MMEGRKTHLTILNTYSHIKTIYNTRLITHTLRMTRFACAMRVFLFFVLGLVS